MFNVYWLNKIKVSNNVLFELIRCFKNGREISDKWFEKYICIFYWYVEKNILFIFIKKNDFFLVFLVYIICIYYWSLL